MKTIIALCLICFSLIGCSGLKEEQIKIAVQENYCKSWFFRDFKLTDFAEFESVTVIKKLSEGNECIVLCEIKFKPKEIKLKPEISTSIYKYDPSQNAEDNKTLERMQRRAEINDAKDYNKTLTDLSNLLKESDNKITRTFMFAKYGGEWLYKGLIPKIKDPFVDYTYAKFYID